MASSPPPVRAQSKRAGSPSGGRLRKRQRTEAASAATTSVDDSGAGGETEPAHTKRSSWRTPAPHGNYAHYYQGHREDDAHRVRALDRALFHGRNCLDVGCNTGMLTLALVAEYAPRTMLGVDIDPLLVARARNRWRSAVHSLFERTATAHVAAEMGVDAVALASGGSETEPAPSAAVRLALVRRRYPASLAYTHGPLVAGLVASSDANTDCVDGLELAELAANPLFGTRFATADVLAMALGSARYETICCFSVTKWVHVNGGDAAIRALFAAIGDALVPGGAFVLEPQPWTSYRNAAKLTAEQRARVATIALRPEAFGDELLASGVFVSARLAYDPATAAAAATAFARRPIWVFIKRSADPAAGPTSSAR